MRRSVGLRSGRVVSSMLSMAVLLLAVPASAYDRPGRTDHFDACRERCTANSTLDPDHGIVSFDARSRYVAFATDAAVDGSFPSLPGFPNAYVYDRTSGKAELVSRGVAGVPPLYLPGASGGGSVNPHISASGRYVAFSSDAINLVAADTNLTRDIFVHDRRTGAIERVNVSSNGDQANGFSNEPAISGDGRYVAFFSDATNLVQGDTNGVADIFVHDRKTRKTERVSVTSDGGEAVADTQGSRGPSISRNGRFVSFYSWADNLAEGDINLAADVFVHDRKTRKTEMVSINSQGEQNNYGAGAQWAAPFGISGNGRYVMFHSVSSNLVPNDANIQIIAIYTAIDLFVHDRKTGRTERVSVSSAGEEAGGNSGTRTSHLTASGRHVLFTSNANDLTPGDTEDPGAPPQTGDHDVFLHDRDTGTTEMISVDSEGREATGCAVFGINPGGHSVARGLSDDGRLALFESCAQLDPRDGKEDDSMSQYVRDRGPVLGVTDLAASGQALRLALEDSPRFSRIGTEWVGKVERGALGRVEGLGQLLGARLTYRPVLEDLHVALELTSMPRTPALAAVTSGSVFGVSFEVDGQAFEIRSVSTGVGARGETTAAFALFSCSGLKGAGCTKVEDLAGGFGTTGDRITFSVPLQLVGAKNGSVFSNVRAFTALGTLLGGPQKILEQASL